MVRARSILVVLTLLVASIAAASPAHAWGRITRCAHHLPEHTHTNRWNFFAGHHMDVGLAECERVANTPGPGGVDRLDWTRRPRISYPTRNIIGGLLEKIDTVAAPRITVVHLYKGVPTWLRYRWSTRQCAPLPGTVGCQTFDFVVTYNAGYGTRICVVGGSCDAWKRW